MADGDMARWRRLADRATEGPWTVHTVGDDHQIIRDANNMWVADCGHAPQDAAFIVAAREGWLACIAEVERLTEEVRTERENVRIMYMGDDFDDVIGGPRLGLERNLRRVNAFARILEQRDAARAELEAMRVVVDAACAGIDGDGDMAVLVEAVDAFRATKEGSRG